MRKFLFLFLSIVSFLHSGVKYELLDLGTLSYSDTFHPLFINDKNQVLGYVSEKSRGHLIGYFIWSEKDGMQIIPAEIRCTEERIKFNNSGEIISLDWGEGIFHWNKENGWEYFPNPYKHGHNILSYNILNQGTFRIHDKVGIWEDNAINLIDDNHHLWQLIESKGYRIMSLPRAYFNDEGSIAGTFIYGKYNTHAKEWVRAGVGRLKFL